MGHADPELTLQRDTIHDFIKVWESLPASEKPNVTAAWRLCFNNLVNVDPKQRWSHAKGIMSATMIVPWDNQWEPILPDRWRFKIDEGDHDAVANLSADSSTKASISAS